MIVTERTGMSEALDAYRRAKERGLNVVVLRDSFLGLDLDKGDHINEDVQEVFLRHGLIEPQPYWLQTKSQHGNDHVYIPLTKARTISERTAMQAALGSDALKEAFSATRFCHHEVEDPKEPFSVLFETDEEYDRVKEWISRLR